MMAGQKGYGMNQAIAFLDDTIKYCEHEMQVFSMRYENAKKNREHLVEIKEFIEGKTSMIPSCH